MSIEQYRRKHDIKKDGCFGGPQRMYECDAAICRTSCDKLSKHRRKLAKRRLRWSEKQKKKGVVNR